MAPTTQEKLLTIATIDLDPPHGQPAWSRVLLGTLASLVGSLIVDALLVVIGTKVFPSTKGYVHFRFSDYAKLTVIGVVIACLGWPIVTRISSAPRRLYALLAVATTIVLLAPDVWILMNGAPVQAVAVLVCMHLAIAVVTYFSMVLIAPVRAQATVES